MSPAPAVLTIVFMTHSRRAPVVPLQNRLWLHTSTLATWRARALCPARTSPLTRRSGDGDDAP
jgi:hypothetical protein